jgi:cellulose synthase (UDP-forming)
VTTLLFLLFPYLYLWTGLQPAAMRFEEYLLAGGPVALFGAAVYLFAQRWLCHSAIERGVHGRGLALKVGCWPVFMLGTVLAIVRADVPYVPTEKRAVRGRFVRLAWPHLTLLALYAITLVAILRDRLVRVDEGSLRLTSEAVWGMVAFATVPATLLCFALFAAWQATRPPAGDAWDAVPVPE